jgi:hemoglobin
VDVDPTSLFDRVGGTAFFDALVERFYDGVVGDPLLAPMYPPGDLDGARRRLSLFLSQYWGGPGTYSEERGHPRLRMRHARFVIDDAARDAWLGHMAVALDGADAIADADRDMLWGYLVAAAEHLRNAG